MKLIQWNIFFEMEEIAPPRRKRRRLMTKESEKGDNVCKDCKKPVKPESP